MRSGEVRPGLVEVGAAVGCADGVPQPEPHGRVHAQPVGLLGGEPGGRARLLAVRAGQFIAGLRHRHGVEADRELLVDAVVPIDQDVRRIAVDTRDAGERDDDARLLLDLADYGLRRRLPDLDAPPGELPEPVVDPADEQDLTGGVADRGERGGQDVLRARRARILVVLQQADHGGILGPWSDVPQADQPRRPARSQKFAGRSPAVQLMRSAVRCSRVYRGRPVRLRLSWGPAGRARSDAASVRRPDGLVGASGRSWRCRRHPSSAIGSTTAPVVLGCEGDQLRSWTSRRRAPWPTTAASDRSRPSGTPSTARPEGGLYYEELMGEEGFSSDSSLLYHRGIPSAVVDATPWELSDQSLTENRPLLPRHLKLHTLFPGEEWKRADVVTGRRLVLGNGDVRISYVAAGEASPLYRNAIGDECVYVESGSATVETVFGALPARQGDYVILPRATTHRWVPDRRRAAARLRDRGQLAHRAAQALPVAVTGSCWSTPPTASATCTGRPSRCWSTGDRRGGAGQAPRLAGDHRHPVRGADAPVRRGRLGRLPLPVHVQRRRLRADHRAGAPAAAGAPGVRGPQLRDLQLRAAQGGLPPAVGAGALLPRQRGLRRGDVLLRRGLRGAQGLRHRAGLDHAAPGRAQPRPAARGDRARRSAWSSSTSWRSWSTRSGRWSWARAAGPARTPPTPGAGRDEGPVDDRPRPRRLAVRPRQPALRGVLPARHRAARRRARRRHVVDLAAALGTDGPDSVFAAPALNPFMAQGRARWVAGPGPDHRAGRRGRPGRRGARGRRRHAAPAVRGRRLRRLLRLGAPRVEPRAAVPARRRAADCRTGSTCRSATTAAPARWSSRAPTSCGPAGQRKAPDDAGADVRPEHPAGHRGRAGLRRRRRVAARAPRSRSTRSPSTCSARCWSTTGPRATCRRGSTCRWARTWARASPPRCHRGWCRCSRWRPHGSRCPARTTRSRCPTCGSRAPWGLDVDLAVEWNGEVVSRPPYREMYWSPAQMLAHMTVNGASARTGDLFASGTISGPAKDQRGRVHRAHLGRPGTDHRQGRGAHVPGRRRRGRAVRHRPGRRRRPDRLRRGPRPDRPEPGRHAVS